MMKGRKLKIWIAILIDIDARLSAARARNSLSEFNDDTAIEEDLAALYLCLSPKKLGELRASGTGPAFIKPTERGSAGRNQPVSYVMGELRRWRLSMSAGSNLEVAKRQGLIGWISGVEPFWSTRKGMIAGSAFDRSADAWADSFLAATDGRMRVMWMSPREALGMLWDRVEKQSQFAGEYFAALETERVAVSAAISATEIASVMQLPPSVAARSG